jgi:hypothetical protein
MSLTHVADVRSVLFFIGQGLYPELPDVLELLGSRPSRVLPLAFARIPVTLQSLMLHLS